MGNNLYFEAIEAAEEIKQAAEEKVKQRLVESMTPQIKALVEKKLFSENEDEKEPLLKGNVEVDDDKSIEAKTEKDCSSENVVEKETIDENKVKDIMQKNAQFTEAFLKIKNIKEGIKNLKKAKVLIENKGDKVTENSKFVYLYKNILLEIKKLKTSSIIKNNNDLLKEFYNINKEIYNMSKRQSSNELDYLLEMNLFEDDEVEDSDEVMPAEDEEMSDAEEMPADDDMPAEDEDSADDLEAALKDIIKTAEDALSDDMSMDDMPADEDDEEDLQLDGLFESDDVDEMVNAGMEEMADETVEEVYESRSRDRVLEIDENMLRREIGKMKAIREGEAKDMASHFGGGSLEGEAFVDGVTLNKLHEVKIKAAKVVRKNRMLESKLSQYKKALRGMKGQLSEMNLFNAKLLYANKLMQNRDLTMKQQRHIVESLDEAKNMGEAKILFESLTKSLVSEKTAPHGSNLTESAIRRSTNSASASVKSAQPLTESVALNRWATLAGIKK